MSWQELVRSRWRWAWEDELWRKSSIVLPPYPASRMKKASQTRCLTFAPYAWRRFTPWGVMRCRRGLRTTHYIVLPRLTDYAAKICSFSLFAKPVLIIFRPIHENRHFHGRYARFLGRGPGYLLYLHDLDFSTPCGRSKWQLGLSLEMKDRIIN